MSLVAPKTEDTAPDWKSFLFLNERNHPRVVTKRHVLYIGFKCNLRCQFCYYLKSIENGTAKNYTFKQLAAQISQVRRLGKEEIDFTGGEATLHADFARLVAHAKAEGFKVINVITNGWRISDREEFKKFVDAGLTEVLFSLHSHEAILHDKLTQRAGSYDRIVKAIGHAHELGLRVRINHVVNPMNVSRLGEFMEFCVPLRPHSVNLIVFNPSEETVGYEGHRNMQIDGYEPIGAAISSALTVYAPRFPVLNVRFLPFCYAKGFETHMRTYWQEIYERQEWDPLLHWAYRKNWFFALGAAMAGRALALFSPGPTRSGRRDLYARVCEWFQLMRTQYLFVRKKECSGCNLRKICPGLPREFARKNPEARVFPYGNDEFPLIENPTFFGFRYPEKFDSVTAAMKERVGMK